MTAEVASIQCLLLEIQVLEAHRKTESLLPINYDALDLTLKFKLRNSEIQTF